MLIKCLARYIIISTLFYKAKLYAAILLHPFRTSAAFLLLSLSAHTELVLWKLCKVKYVVEF